jgi:peptide-methionine (S)-S-oxide reductase
VLRTRVGYAGGDKVNPTYHDLGNHSETIEIGYDPTQITYEELLRVFWETVEGATCGVTLQYASIIHYHDEAQREAAERSLAQEEGRAGRRLAVTIRPAGVFYPAEAYHQKYYLRSVRAVEREYKAIYPTVDAFVRSTAVARANGYIGGYGVRADLERELDAMGLSAQGKAALLREAR